MDDLSLEECLALAKSKLKDIESIISAQNSLHEFMRQAWPMVEGGVPFVDGWHIGAMAEHIEALSNREIKKLLINVPPRSTKSTLISVMLPAWIWINKPEEKFLYAAYKHTISLKDSVNCRRLIQSEWYQSRWGHLYQIVGDQNTKGKFNNDKAGYRLISSVSASGTTGDGGDFLITDDPNSSEEIRSKIKRERAIEWFSRGWAIRKNNPKDTVMLNVQQRFHEDDISGHIISSDDDDEWTKLILPMEYEPIRRCFTIPLKSTNGELWRDPREKDGELLWPERFGEKELKELKKSLKSAYNIAGQLQQRPAPEEGGIIKKTWFRWWKEEQYPKFIHTIQSWDTAFSDKKDSSYSACTTWGIFYGDHNIPNLMLIGMWRGHVLYPELRKIAQKMAKDYRDDGTNEFFTANYNFKPDLILVEAKASGQVLIADLRRAGVMCTGFNPGKYGDKEGRLQAETGSHMIECGRVWVPAMAPNYKQLKPFADEFVEECALFPNASSSDLVDTMSQVLIRVSQSNLLKNPSDEDDPPTNSPMRFIY
jgi:phage terminase large subunit-like protein